MGKLGLSRPAGSRPERRRPPGHHLWMAERVTGILTLGLETPEGQFVGPGTGRLRLVESNGEEVVASEAARSAGVPVLPGSGIKGAVRTLYELLSHSCDPLAHAGGGKHNKKDPQERCSAHSCCDACAMFGCIAGRQQCYSGRVTFSDAVPAGEGAVETSVSRVPIPWEPKGHKTPGDFRLYDLRKATVFDKKAQKKRPAPEKLAKEVFRGRFETSMAFTNLTEEELGRLLLVMGLKPTGDTRFLLRLGGAKYHGKGGVRVRPLRVVLASPETADESGSDCLARCDAWLEAAATSHWAQVFWTTLEELADALSATERT